MHDAYAKQLVEIPSGTLATVLRQNGFRRVWMLGPRPLVNSRQRIAGKALTIRFVPAREDLTTPASLSSPDSLRALLDQRHPGRVLVAATGGILDAGVIGDILAVRMVQNGCIGLVTDGVVRDVAAIAPSGLPVWAAGVAAPPSVAGLHFCEAGGMVACGGVTVAPDDYIVADEDGAVIVPAKMVGEVIREATEKERFEAWVLAQVKEGAALMGLYPPSPETKARYMEESQS